MASVGPATTMLTDASAPELAGPTVGMYPSRAEAPTGTQLPVGARPPAAKAPPEANPLLHGCYISAVSRPCKIGDHADYLVGVTGFEPVAPRSQSECATKLRHTPCRAV